MKVYWPAAFELRHGTGSEREIMPGPGTADSCERALLASEQSGDLAYIIVPTAGVSPDPQWKGVPMSQVMYEYLLDGSTGVSHKILHRVAKRFDTIGEVQEIVSLIEENPSINEVVICCKWWHILRCWITLRIYLALSKKIDGPVRVGVEPCESRVEDHVIFREFWLAIPLNMLKIFFDQPLLLFKLVPKFLMPNKE